MLTAVATQEEGSLLSAVAKTRWLEDYFSRDSS